jgi:hypothetical protein
MTRAQRILSLGLFAALGALPQLSLSQPPKLQHDPFARPALGGLQQARQPEPRGNGKPTAVVASPRLRLLAVMAAGANSIANVDGVMLRIGDEVHGYKLVEVKERNAVFEKNKTRFNVSISGNRQASERAGDTQ